MAGPLAGVRVLDLSRILAGPWATQVLADYGADVIKVEHPGTGDDTRHWGPPWLKDAMGEPTQTAAYYLAANRGKRSIAIDLAKPEGQQLVRDLAGASDVLVENYKLGTLARFGLDYATLSALHPKLVYCSITGYGQTGPYANRAGYDAAIQAVGGLMSITGDADGAPVKVGVAVADLMAGMYAVSAILAALRERDSSGLGQHIDLALLDTQVAWLANQALNYLVGGRAPQRMGSAHPNIAPYQVVSCKDGFFMLAVGNDAQFRRCCMALGLPRLAHDPRYGANADRVANRAALIAELAPALRERTAREWLEELEQAGVPCAPVNDLAAVFADPQVQARGMRLSLPGPAGSNVPSVANPVRFSRTPTEYGRAPPGLGAETDAVLREVLSLNEGAIAGLRAGGAIS